MVVHKQIYIELKNKVNNMIADSKVDYLKEKLGRASASHSTLFQYINSLLNRSQSSSLPDHDSAEELANRFSNFFKEKIDKIRSNLEIFQQSHNIRRLPEVPLVSESQLLSKFKQASEEEIMKIIRSSATKSCSLDPIPTQLLKRCLDALLPVITRIINCSLASSTVPDCFKVAAVRPLLKKHNLDPNILKNFRPVSNLPFISKILEKVVASRMNNHKDSLWLNEKMQSAYR